MKKKTKDKEQEIKDNLDTGFRGIILDFPKFVSCRIIRDFQSSFIEFKNLKIQFSDIKNLNFSEIDFTIYDEAEKITDKNIGSITFYTLSERKYMVSGHSYLNTNTFNSLVQSIENSGRDYLHNLSICVRVDKKKFNEFISQDEEPCDFLIKSFALVFSMD